MVLTVTFNDEIFEKTGVPLSLASTHTMTVGFFSRFSGFNCINSPELTLTEKLLSTFPPKQATNCIIFQKMMQQREILDFVQLFSDEIVLSPKLLCCLVIVQAKSIVTLSVSETITPLRPSGRLETTAKQNNAFNFLVCYSSQALEHCEEQ